MNWKNESIVGTQLRKKIIRLRWRLLVLIALLMVGNACHHRKTRKEQTQSADTPVTSVLNYSCALSPTEGFGILSVLNQATVAEEKDRLLIHANGTDSQLGFTVTAPGRYAVRLDIGSPSATLLELFYRVQNTPFSAEHVIQSPLKAGRNQLLLEINDPRSA